MSKIPHSRQNFRRGERVKWWDQVLQAHETGTIIGKLSRRNPYTYRIRNARPVRWSRHVEPS